MAPQADTAVSAVVQFKTCSKCSGSKPATRDHFSPLKKAKDGLHSWCKPCSAAWRRKDRAENKERYSAIERARYERHGEARRAYNRRNWAENREQYLRAARKREREKREQYNEARRARFAACAERRKRRAEENRRWRERNAEQLKARRAADWRNATPTQKLRSHFGAAISHALKGSGKGGRSWQELVGYRAEDLRDHLERQFTKGMTWENYGEWHVDHIIPLSSFEYTSPDDPEFKACWALTNLRPLWARENIRKSDRRTLLL